MILGHSIALDPTPDQAEYFRRASGTARFAFNWGLAEWKRMHEAGEKPSMQKIKAAWNRHRKAELPWTYEVTKCASGQAIADLGSAFSNFFRDLKKPAKQRRSRYPRFKRKRDDEGFALWNDQFVVADCRVRIPLLGWVRMREPLRLSGKIMGARVSCRAGRWMLSVQVDTDVNLPPAPVGSVVGVDLGVSSLAILSTGEVVSGPKARRNFLSRMKRLQRRVSLQRHRAQRASNRQKVRMKRLQKLHHRMACIRKDAAHKLTTDLTSRFETVVIEDLNVAGMAKNHSLSGAILDAGWSEIRRQLGYKTAMRGGRVVVADRFFPSSKTCFDCGHIVQAMPLSMREWICPNCGVAHDRDVNAARNLARLGAASAEETHGDTLPLFNSDEIEKAAWMNRELETVPNGTQPRRQH